MKFLTVIALALSFSVNAKQADPFPMETCKAQAIYGFPSSRKQSTTQICRKAYVLEHDNNAKIPIWVSYVLTPDHAIGCLVRTNAFAADQSLPASARSNKKDYAKSPYDKGHMANDGDMRWDLQAELESFIMSNMVPQLPRFNRGIWSKLEERTRAWALSREHPLQIYTGPVYSRASSTTIGNDVIVPTAFWKVIIDTVTGDMMVYLIPHESDGSNLSGYMTSLAEVQRQANVVLPVPKTVVRSETAWNLTTTTSRAARTLNCSGTK